MSMATLLTTIPWAIGLIMMPLLGALGAVLWPRAGARLGLLVALAALLSLTGLGYQLLQTGVYHHAIGGWNAPLGIALYADGLSLVMLAITALVGCGVSSYASGYFEAAQSSRFWPLWLLLQGALNALFLSADIFNLYVTLELLGLSAVALTALSGSTDALSGAMRYLLATLLGSLAYLLGVALLYHGFGSLDISLLAARIEPTPAAQAALGLICAGLTLKTALFPLHFWLPPAHASASAPVSALLSGLVVKASFYILLRLWLTVFAELDSGVDTLLGLLGAAAILWGSLQALRQARLKLLVAYSTVAQIGYLFLAFPLIVAPAAAAWIPAAYLALSHGLAKAAMFMAAGNIIRVCGHDRIADLAQPLQRLPLTAAAFALAGVSIMGLPPSGGFIGKWLLLEAALTRNRWDLVVVILVGGLLAAIYVFKVIKPGFSALTTEPAPAAVPARLEWTALLLALAALALGLLAAPLLTLMAIGEPPVVAAEPGR